MKLHLPVSLRKSLLAVLAVIAGVTCPTVDAGVMHSDATIATYTDFGQNKGRFVIGDSVNSLLQYIRDTEGGIGIEYTDGTPTYYISNQQGMIDFSGVHDGGHSGLVGVNFLASVLHNGSLAGSFTENDIGSGYAQNYSVLDIRGSNKFRLGAPNGNDYVLQRQTRVVTDAVGAAVATVDITTLSGQHMYHCGAGDMGMYHESTGTTQTLAGGYNFSIGDIDQLTGVGIQADGVSFGIYKDVGYGNGIGASLENPLPNATRSGDSGSPVYIYNSATGQYEYIAAHQSGNGRSWGQARGNTVWTKEAMESFNVNVAGYGVSEWTLGAVNATGNTVTDNLGNISTSYTGTVTGGARSFTFNGVKDGEFTWRDMSDIKDSQTWYTYDASTYNETSNADGKLNQSVADLFYTQNLVFIASTEETSIVLGATVDMGAGYMEFTKGSQSLAKYTITGNGTQLHTAGYVVNAGTEVHLKLTNPDNYMTEWRKLGAGDFYIDGTGDTNALLNVGGKGKTYLQQTDGYAAYNVLANTGATVVIKDIGQIKRDFTFGAGGGTLDMNGNSMDWYTSNGETPRNGSFTINALTEEAMITNSAATGVTLTYKETGDTVYKGSFSDTASGSLTIDYQGSGTWTLNSIHTKFTNAGSGLKVTDGKVVLQGTNTLHGLGSHNGHNVARLANTQDWHYADSTMNVTVKDGATFELGSHARLTGNVAVETGGTYIMREGVQHAMEYVEGGQKLEDTGKYAAFYGHKGDVSLAENATMKVVYSEGTTVNNLYGGRISGAGNVEIDLGSDKMMFTLSGENTFTGKKTLTSGGLIATGNAALGDVSTNKWVVGKDAWLASRGFVDGAGIMRYIDASSTGTLALSNDLTTQLDFSQHKSLYLGAEAGKTVQYGTAGTSDTLDAVDGAWRLGGGGGKLVVNYKLTGASNLMLGASEGSTGAVHLTNTGNDFTGSITFAGSGVMLSYEAGGLGQSSVSLSYGNGMLLSQGADVSRISASSDGFAIVDGIGTQDMNLRDHSSLAIGASVDTEYSGNITLADGAAYRFGAMNGATLTVTSALAAERGIVVDGQGTTGGTVVLKGNSSFAGDIVVQGSKDAEVAGDVTLAMGQDATATGAIELKAGGYLDVAGRQFTVKGDLTGAGAVVDSTGKGSLVLDTANGALSPTAALNLETVRKVGAHALNLQGQHAFGSLHVEEGSAILQEGFTVSGDSQIFLGNGTTLDMQSESTGVNLAMKADAGIATLAIAADSSAKLSGDIRLGSGSQLNMQGGSEGIFQLSGSAYGGEGATLSVTAKDLQFVTNSQVDITGRLSVEKDMRIYSDGRADNMARNISHLHINDAAVSLGEASWNTVWTVGKLTGEGSLNWDSTTTHNFTSRLILSGEGDFAGTISLNRTYENAKRTHGAFIELAHDGAARNASVALTGKSTTAVASLAVNTDNARIKGLDGNQHSYVYAGAAMEAAALTGGLRPDTTRTATLTVDVDAERIFTYSGTIGQSSDTTGNGISLVKKGAGTQILNGNTTVNNLVAREGILQQTEGTLSVRGNLGVGYGATLNIGDFTLTEGKTLSVLGGGDGAGSSAVFGGTLSLNGGALAFSGDAMLSAQANDHAALSLGGLRSSVLTQTINFTDTTALKGGETYTLATGDWSSVGNFATTGLHYYNATYTNGVDGLKVTMSLMDDCQIWDGDNTSSAWNSSKFGAQNSSLTTTSTAVFDSSAAGKSVQVGSDMSVSRVIFNTAEAYTVSKNGGVATTGTLLVQGGGEVCIEGGMKVNGLTTIEAGSLVVKDTGILNGNVTGDGTLVVDWGKSKAATLTLAGLDTLHIKSGTFGSNTAPQQNVANVIVEADGTYAQGVGTEFNGNMTFRGGALRMFSGAVSGNLVLEGDLRLQVISGGLPSEMKTRLTSNGHTITQTSDSTSGVVKFGSAFEGVLDNYVVERGTMEFAAKAHSGHGTISLKPEGALQVDGNTSLSATRLNVEGGRVALQGQATLMTDIRVADKSTFNFSSQGSAIKGSISGSGVVTFAGDSGASTLAQAVIFDGDAALGVEVNSGTVSLMAANTHTGGTTINNGGTLIARNAHALGSGVLTVNSGGTLQLDITGLGALGSISGLALNGGVVDATAGQFLGAGLALGGDISATGGYIDLGSSMNATGTTYTIFDLAGGNATMDNLDSLGAYIVVNGNKLNSYKDANFVRNGNLVTLSFDSFDLASFEWAGGSSPSRWDAATAAWDVTPDVPGDNIAYSNGVNVVFSSDADVDVAEGVSTYNMEIKDGVSLTTRGKVDIQGTLTVGNNVSWDYSGSGMSLSFTEGEMSRFKSLNVGDGASLNMTSATGDGTTSAAMDKVTGTGTVNLSLSGDGRGKGFNFSGITGDIKLNSGKLRADLSTFNESATLHLKGAGSGLIFGGADTEVKNDIVVSGGTNLYVNSGKSGVISGVISGSGGLIIEGPWSGAAGQLTLKSQSTYTGTTVLYYGSNLVLDLGGNQTYRLNGAVQGWYGAAITVASGTTLNNNGFSISSDLVVKNGGRAEFNRLDRMSSSARVEAGGTFGVNEILSGTSIAANSGNFALSGAGTLALNLSGDTWNKLAVSSGFTGTTYVRQGALTVAGSSFGSTLKLANGVNAALTTSAAATTLAKNLVLEGASSMSTVENSTMTISGSVTGDAGAATQTGAGAVVYNGAVNLSSYTMAGTGSATFNGSTQLDSLSVQSGTVMLGSTAMSLLSTAGSVNLSGGTLDISAGSYTESSGVSLGAALNVTGGLLDLGNLGGAGTYTIFNITGSGAVDNWESMGSNLMVNGTTLSRLAGYDLILADGVAKLTITDATATVYDLQWAGGASGSWDYTSANWDATPGTSGDSATFSNTDSVTFAADASVSVVDGVSVTDMTIAEGATLTTQGGVGITGSLKMGAGSSWTLASGTEQSLTEDQLKSIGSSLVVAEGATLEMTNKNTAANDTSTAFNKVSGSGDVVLNLAADNGVGFNLAGVSGDITVAAGRLQVNTSTFNENSTIYLKSADSQLVFNSDNNPDLKNNVVLNAASTDIHVNSGKSGTISGVISGGGGLDKQGAGTLTLKARNTYTGATTISSGKIILDIGGAYELKNSVSGSGTLEIARGTSLDSKGKSLTTALVINEGASASLWGNKSIGGDITVQDNATLRFTGTDAINHDTGKNILVNGGTLDFGETRQTMGGWTLKLNSDATVMGTGRDDATTNRAAFDYNRNGSIFATSGDNTIEAPIRVRDGVTLTFDVSTDTSLEVSGHIFDDGGETGSGSLVKDGAGKLVLSSTVGNTYRGTTTVNAGELTIRTDSMTLNPGSLVLADGVTLNLEGGAYQLADGNISSNDKATINFRGTSMTAAGAGTNTTFNGTFNMLSDATLNAAAKGGGTAWATDGPNITGTMTVGKDKTLTVTGDSRVQISDGGVLLLQDGAKVDRTSNGAFYIKGSLAVAEDAKATFMSGNDIHLNYINADVDLGDTGGSIDVADGASLVVAVRGLTSYGNAELNVGRNASLDLTGTTVSLGADTTMNMGKGGSIAFSNVEFSNKGAADNATVKGSLGSYELTNGHVKSTAAAGATIGQKLVNSSVENAGGGTLRVTGTGNTITGVVASGGNITLQSAGETMTLQVLKLAAGKTVNAYVGSGEDAMVTLSVTSSAVLSGAATLNSSLTLTGGSVLDMTDLELGAVALNGSLTFGGQVTLGDNLLSIVNVMSSGNEESLTLFTGLSSASLPGLTELKDFDKVLASDVFTNVDNDRLYITYQMIDNAGNLMLVLIPEPATATLSLMALAALAARRRRK